MPLTDRQTQTDRGTQVHCSSFVLRTVG